MKCTMFILVSLFCALVNSAVSADDLNLDDMPPVVVKTVPEAGASEVGPKLKEIRVTFSKDMQDRNWSWYTVTKDSFPKVDGNPKYLADKRTCVLPVSLRPGKTYAIWINSENARRSPRGSMSLDEPLVFEDTHGRIAAPYLLVFRTER
jgi:hypothetical protein